MTGKAAPEQKDDGKREDVHPQRVSDTVVTE